MLVLTKLIGNGAKRLCFEHPLDDRKCVKVSLNPAEISQLQRELAVYPHIKSLLGDAIPHHDPELVMTDKGLGLVCELVRDDDQAISGSLYDYVLTDRLDAEIRKEIDAFTCQISRHDLFFYDFNIKNFVIQIKDGKKRLRYIDLKSYRKAKPWTYLRMENVFPFFARRMMRGRLQKLYRFLKQPFPACA